MFISVGRGELYSADVVRAIYPDFKEERKAGPAVAPGESGWFGLAKAANLVFRVPGKGEDGDAAAAARRRMGYAGAFRPQGRRGAGRAHRRHPHAGRGHHRSIRSIRPALVAFDDKPELWLDVRWDLDTAPRRSIRRRSW